MMRWIYFAGVVVLVTLVTLAVTNAGNSNAQGLAEECPRLLGVWPCRVYSKRPTIQDVSLGALLARPEIFDGREMELYGVLSKSSEEASLYLDPFSYEYGIVHNSVELEYDDASLTRDVSPGAVVRILGKFRLANPKDWLARVGHIQVHDLTVSPSKEEEEKGLRKMIEEFDRKHQRP